MAIDGAAWLGLGGVVVGGVMGYASSAVQEAARRRHERQRLREQEEREDWIRFEDRRFDAYVAMITAATRVYGLAKYPGLEPAVDADTYRSRLYNAYEDFVASLSPVYLTTSSVGTRDRVSALARTVRDLREAAAEAGAPGARGLDPLLGAHRRAVKEVEAVMRDEFGLGRLPAP